MGALLALLAIAGAIGLVAWPLLRGSQAGEPAATGTDDLAGQRDMVIDELRELDFDRELGNLTEEDHRLLRERSKRRAVAVLKALNHQDSRIDQEIEQAVAALRGGHDGSK